MMLKSNTVEPLNSCHLRYKSREVAISWGFDNGKAFGIQVAAIRGSTVLCFTYLVIAIVHSIFNMINPYWIARNNRNITGHTYKLFSFDALQKQAKAIDKGQTYTYAD